MTTNTGAVYSWGDDPWVLSLIPNIQRAVNVILGRVTKPTVPVVYFRFDGGAPAHTLATGRNDAPWAATILLNTTRTWWAGESDFTSVVCHEVLHGLGCWDHGVNPLSLSYRLARPAWNPWNWVFTDEDVTLLNKGGWVVHQANPWLRHAGTKLIPEGGT